MSVLFLNKLNTVIMNWNQLKWTKLCTLFNHFSTLCFINLELFQFSCFIGLVMFVCWTFVFQFTALTASWQLSPEASENLPFFCLKSMGSDHHLTRGSVYLLPSRSQWRCDQLRSLPPSPPTCSHPPWRHSLVSPHSFVEAQTTHKLYLFSLR